MREPRVPASSIRGQLRLHGGDGSDGLPRLVEVAEDFLVEHQQRMAE